ncbi:MAG: hypothetical protein L3J23_07290 [Flavobacteriaceae bacterium]|nr:hypothetical protein [Flavobacteriaceae bacterium]
MKSKYNHRVNWIDGMKINKNHFIDFENSIISIINNSEKNHLSATQFGLLPDFSDQGSSIDISISIDGQSTIEVILNKCKAVTLGGYQIDITKEAITLLEQSGHLLKQKYSINKEEEEWFVVLAVNPTSRIPVGNADPDEEPPRHPFVISEYKLDILPKSEISAKEIGLYHLTLGKIILIDEVPTLDENFIPPCTSVQSHADLKFVYVEISVFLNQMEAYTTHIIQKIFQKKQTNDLAHMVLALSQKVLQYLNSNISEFRLKDKNEPPLEMILKLMNLARVIKSNLDLFIGTGKEGLLNYLTDWCDLNQGAFENVMIDMIELEYVHTDINDSLLNASNFTRLMLPLFKKLSELDYIGSKENSNIFVKEEIVDKEIKSRRSFLLD